MTHYTALVDAEGTAWAVGIGETYEEAWGAAEADYQGFIDTQDSNLEYIEITEAENQAILEVGRVKWRGGREVYCSEEWRKRALAASCQLSIADAPSFPEMPALTVGRADTSGWYLVQTQKSPKEIEAELITLERLASPRRTGKTSKYRCDLILVIFLVVVPDPTYY